MIIGLKKMKFKQNSAVVTLIIGPLFANTVLAADIVVSTPTTTSINLAGSSLTVTATGSIVPGTNPFTPVYLSQSTATSITNNGLLQGSTVSPQGSISIDGSVISGSIINNGSIFNNGYYAYAILMSRSSGPAPVIQGGIINTGTMSVSGTGNSQVIELQAATSATINEGINNSGLMELVSETSNGSIIKLNGATTINGGIANSGTMTSSQRIITSGGSIDSITNTGLMSANGDAIFTNNSIAAPASIGTITNQGTISSTTGFSINNTSGIPLTTLNNLQGLNGSGGTQLTYKGKLPNNYFIITDGARYGQLQAFSAVAPASTTMTFGVYGGSNIQALTYNSVLSGISSSLINPASLNGVLNANSTWSLQEANSGVWNLVVFFNTMSAGSSFISSNIGTNFNPTFAGGTLVMNQANATYSENFTVNTGTTSSIDQDGNTSTFAGTFTGTGNLTISNSGNGGKLTFTGTNTSYSGTTTINNGADVAVNGSMAGQFIVSSGGILQGNGSFGGGTIKAGGIIAPGNSIGTITSNGALTFASGSTYQVEVNSAGQSDKTVVNGTATLQGGKVSVVSYDNSPAYLPTKKYTILTATGGVSGKFDGASSIGYSFLTPTLYYGSNDVTIGFALTPFSTVAKNINQRNVGNALTIAALGPVNSLGAPILNALFYGNYEDAQAVMDTVGGSGLAGVQSTAMQVGEIASSSVSDQIAFWRSGETMDATGRTSQEGNNPRNFLAYAPVQRNVPAKGPINLKGPAGSLTAAVAPRTFRAWGSMFGGGANYLSDAGRGAAASNIGYYGGLIGVDYQVQPNILVGVAVGGSSSSFNVGSLSTNGNLTGFHAGVYGAYTMGNSYIALNETFSAYNNQTSRKAGGYAYLPYEQLSAQFGSTEFRTRGELGHGVLMGGLKATPFIAAEIAAYQSNAFSEQSSIYASTFALKNNGQGINSLPTFAGLRLSNAVTLSNGWRLAPVGSVAYVHEFFPQRQFNNILMSMPSSDFNVAGPRSTYNLVQTKIGAQLNLNEKLALFTDFQGEFSPVSQSYAGKGGVKYIW